MVLTKDKNNLKLGSSVIIFMMAFKMLQEIKINVNPRNPGGGGWIPPPLPSLSRLSQITH